MDAIQLLTERSSMPRLIAPAPDQSVRELLQRAALRVPDHMGLTPFRVLAFEDESLHQLGELFQRAAEAERMSPTTQARASQLPLRAPLLLAVVTNYQQHPSVPYPEQHATAACAAHAIIQACFACGFGAIWRTGEFSQSAMVKQGLGLAANDDILGFLYIGTPAVPIPIKPEKTMSPWQAGTVTLP